jgi:hypothetical protein
MKRYVLFLLLLIPFIGFAQKKFTNKKGGYKIVVPEKWTVEQDGEITSVYAPDEEEMDTWREKLEISLIDANDLNLEEAFQFYMEEDLPTNYNGIIIERQGDEVINGLPVHWAVFSFAGSGTVGSSEVSFRLYNIFYLTKKGEKLYMLNGIAEKSYFPKLETGFLEIIRSFQLTK